MAETHTKKKEFTYRGKTMEELKQMDLREFSKLLRSNQRRTILRQTDQIQKFLVKCRNNTAKNKAIRTHQRNLVVAPMMVGLKIQVYNGKTFIPIDITPEMLGHRLGEFSLTRTKVKHGAAGIGATRSSSALSVK